MRYCIYCFFLYTCLRRQYVIDLNEINVNDLKIDYVQLWVLYKSDLFISMLREKYRNYQN